MRLLSLLAISFLLISCSSNNIDIVKSQTTLDITMPEPLALKQVVWTIDDNNSFCVDSDNFTNLSTDMELVQNRLYLYHNMILSYQSFYENKD